MKTSMEVFKVLVLLSTVMLAGCITKEGMLIKQSSAKYSAIETEKCESKGCPDEIIVIGTLSAYRDIEKNIDKEYQAYIASAKKFIGDEPVSLSLDEFTKSVQGWTKAQVYLIPLIGASYASVFISSEQAKELNFASTVESFLVQGTGDLVSARSNSDGLLFVEKLLCDTYNDYGDCKKKFLRGAFDAKTGEQLNYNLVVKKNGKTINIDTYELIQIE